MMCTDSTEKELRSLCFEDSGDPLIQKNGKGKDVAVGLISFRGKKCTYLPGVYTGISKERRWINNTTQKNKGGDLSRFCVL
mmetsp:Transcript_9425/g.19219  ORF Transcript_9425/g.19219 Transcript_9425/m.19219 type:complete len:81 (-) Transcript_9425:156-398(-)